MRLLGPLVVLLVLESSAAAEVVWKDNDDWPIAEPEEDDEGDHIWWEGVRDMMLYPASKVLDLGELAHGLVELVGVVGPHEAANVNGLDEAPDSTWFTNRHGRRRLPAAELARGPSRAPPAPVGPLIVLSGKAHGMSPGFVVEDRKGDRYVVKFDAPGYSEVATGAEIVCSKIVYALGWNVPEYDLFTLDPARLRLAENAWVKDEYGRKRRMTGGDLQRVLDRAARRADGSIRAIASRYIGGEPKGPFRTLGVRPDDANDTVPHEDRRDLRGFRVVAAWINYTDARRGNFYDSFVRSDGTKKGPGILLHYIIDFSSALGSGNDDWKAPRYGHEYLVDPRKLLLRAVTLGLWKPPWATVPLTHPALGYFESSTFDPDEWRPTYLNPLFDRATMRDAFWAAKLVASLTDDDLAVIVHTGEWSDSEAERLLATILRERRRRIARAYFDFRKINPIDGFTAEGEVLRYHDLAAETGIVDSRAEYRHRVPMGEWVSSEKPEAMLLGGGDREVIELETSHDGGRSWSPTTTVELEADPGGRAEVTRIEREIR